MFFAACLWTGFVYTKSIWLATLLVMAVALERELEQKDWQVSEVGKTDLFFFLLACVVLDIWYYLFR